jgi:hypothetical protein
VKWSDPIQEILDAAAKKTRWEDLFVLGDSRVTVDGKALDGLRVLDFDVKLVGDLGDAYTQEFDAYTQEFDAIKARFRADFAASLRPHVPTPVSEIGWSVGYAP